MQEITNKNKMHKKIVLKNSRNEQNRIKGRKKGFYNLKILFSDISVSFSMA